nr:ribonuclease H-like domain-containing protein [Tanacetum cinerariifolium]
MLLILKRAPVVNCNPSRTPVDIESKLGADGDPVCLYVHDPQEPYFLKRILRYVRAFGKHFEEIHVTLTQFGKKHDKDATLQNFNQAWFISRGDGIKISI